MPHGITNLCRISVHKKHRTCWTFPMAKPKCLMRDFTNLNRIYKATWTNVWRTMKVFGYTVGYAGCCSSQSISIISAISMRRNYTKFQYVYIFPGKISTYKWFNPLWPNDVIWHHRIWSTLFQIMACCLMAPSHYLNQCWLIISDVFWHSPQGLNISFLQAKPWIPGGEKSIFKVVIH